MRAIPWILGFGLSAVMACSDDGGPTVPVDASVQPDSGVSRPDGGDEDVDMGVGGPDSGVDGGVARCGDGNVDPGEVCDDGAANSDTTPDACRTDCTLPRCGDGVVDPASGETCDDGNTIPGDGCSSSCEDENECELGTADCSFHEVCINEAPGFRCECSGGAFVLANACFRYPLPRENPVALSPIFDTANPLAAGHFDDDGVVDLLVSSVNRGQGAEVYPMLGQADGTFRHPANAPSTPYAFNSTAWLAPLDGNTTGDWVFDADPSPPFFFEDGVNRTSFDGGARNVLAVTDIDEDGRTEVVTRTLTGLLIHDGATVKQTIGFPAPVQHVETQDVSGDDLPDLVISGGGVFVALNDGPPSYAFGGFSPVPDTQRVFRFVLGDVDNDGAADLIVDRSRYYRPNDGAGTFGAQVDLPWSASSEIYVFDDFTSDGRPDVTYRTGQTLVVHPRAASGQLESGRAYRTGTVPSEHFFDADQDGLIDIVIQGDRAVGLEFRSPLLFARGTPTGPSLPRYTGIDSSERIAVADLDGDDDLDAVSYAVSGSSNPARRLNDGAGTFTGRALAGFGGSARRMDIADVDDDDRPDLVVLRDDLHVYAGIDGGTFDPTTVVTSSDIPESFVLLDVDGDDDLDLIGCTDSRLQVYTNTDRAFTAGASLPNGRCPVATGNLNGDAFPDLIAGVGGPTLGAFLGSANGSFSAGANFVPPSAARELHLDDVSGDGRDDVIIGGANLLYVPTTPTGFGQVVDLGTCSLAAVPSPTSPQSADLDGDGSRDIVSLCLTRVRVALNRGPTGFEVFDMPSLGAEQLWVRDMDGDNRQDLFLVGRRGMWLAGTRSP